MSIPYEPLEPPVSSAVLKGDAIALSLSSISFLLDSGSSEAAISLLYAAATPPSMCIDPHLAEGHAYRWYIPVALCCVCPATP